MTTNTSEAENPLENEKKGTQRGHKTAVSPFPIPFPSTSNATETRGIRGNTPRAGRDSVAYWKTRVRPRIIRGTPSPELYARFKEAGHDAWLCLDTSNVATAAAKARDLYLRMKAIGLPALLAELRPDARPQRSATVGEFIAAAHLLCKVRPRTLAQYETSLRRIVAGVCKLDGDESRFDYRTGGADRWREKIDAVSLDKLTPAAVEAWRISWASEAEGESDRIAREHSAATYVRNARSLFSADLLAVLRERVRLPERLPFAGLSAAASTRRFVPTVEARSLYARAWQDLATTPDTLAAFVLLIVAGLRRAEADLLPWDHVTLTGDTPALRVAATAHFRPKTEESAREIPLPADVARFLAVLRAEHPAAEFVLAGNAPKTAARTNNYRAEAWKPLAKWLRAQGVKSRNPLHEVRKLSGSLVNAVAGLEAARRHLGHANISTTSNSYVAARAVTIDLAPVALAAATPAASK